MKHTLMKLKEAFAVPLRNGLTKPSKVRGSGIPMVNMKEIFAYNKIYDDTPMELVPVTEKELENTSLEFGDLLFARQSLTEEGAGKVCIYKGHQTKVFESHLIRCRLDKSRFNSDYFYYFFSSSTGKALVSTIVQQTAAAGIRGSDLQELEIPVPPLPEQKAIASVLSSLDDKIDLLHRQNKTLEAMAETLFRQWFIEEAKEDWEEVPLSEVAVIQNGYAFSSKDYVEKTVNEYEVLKMGHIDKNATLKLNPKRDYVPRKPELKRFVLNYNDIVMPMTDMKDNVVILGVPALVDANDKYVLNQRVARIYLKEDSKLSSIYYLFLQLKDPDFIARLQSTANSGVQVNLSTQAIKDCPIVIPSLEKQAEHRNTITGFYEQISNNRKQIQTLEKLRDTLLPKLMSGEVRVNLSH